MSEPNYSIPSKKLGNKKLYPLVAEARATYSDISKNNSDFRTNFVVWASEVQKLTFDQMGDMELFGLKKSQLNNIYVAAKGKRS